MKRICLFSGSSPGARPEYAEAARAMGRELAARGLELVYGGARIGLMREAADAVMAHGGRVTGVMPRFMVEHGVAHEGLDKLHVVETMHERKAMMAGLADGFIALPGGLGTFEELFEAITWSQIGLHAKPCGILNVCGYYDALEGLLAHASQEGFIRDSTETLLLASDAPAALLDAFAAYEPPAVRKFNRA
jgi:hypothetical protein